MIQTLKRILKKRNRNKRLTKNLAIYKKESYHKQYKYKDNLVWQFIDWDILLEKW